MYTNATLIIINNKETISRSVATDVKKKGKEIMRCNHNPTLKGKEILLCHVASQ